MPTPATSKWPAPKSEDEWEDMVLDAMRLLWRDPNAQRNGRRGQRQFGVDIFGSVDVLPVAAQAKNMDSISEAIILDEAAKACQFKPELQQYHIAVAGRRDAHVQQFVRMLSLDRAHQGLFPLYIHFFDDVVDLLSSRPELVQKYWGAFLALMNLLDTLPTVLCGPVLSPGAAVERVMALPQMREYSRLIENQIGSSARLKMMVEQTPDLHAAAKSLDRSWKLALGEDTPQRFTRTIRIAVDIESGNLMFWVAANDSWVSRSEWQQRNFQ
jgi:hypothetical protein